MSAETAIAIGVSSRVLANVACTSNPRLGAAIVGCGTGFVIHQGWVRNTIQDPIIIIIIFAGLVFDHYFFDGVEGTITLLLACGLGVVIADFGPDLLYEVLGEQYFRELESLIPFTSDDPASDYEDDGGSVVSKNSSRHTSRSGRTGTSVTVRPSRPRVTTAPSTITRSSRVTFDENSLAPSQSSEAEYENGTDGGGMYMEPSSMASGSTRTRVTVRPPSILRRMSMPSAPTTTATTTTSLPSVLSQSQTTRTSTETDTTPRGHHRGPDELTTPSELQSDLYPSSSVPFPEPEPSLPNPHEYSTQTQSTSRSDVTQTPDFSESIPLSDQRQPSYEHTYEHVQRPSEPHDPSLLERIMNVPIVDPHHDPEHHPDPGPEYSQARERSRSRSPVRPESILSPQVETPNPAIQEALEDAWVRVPEPYKPDNFGEPTLAVIFIFHANIDYRFTEDRMVDVRKLDRETALQKIEEAWKTVENRKHRRLNVLVNHDDDDQMKNHSNFHLMEDLER